MKTFLIIAVIVLAVLGGGIFFIAPTIKAKMLEASTQSGMEVRIEAVKVGELVQTVSAPGRIKPHTKVEISARVNSEIVALPFREGETVEEGDIVVQLDDRDLKARLTGQQAALDSAKANVASVKASRARTEAQLNEQTERRNGVLTNLEFAERTLARKQELYDTGDIALTELEAASERVEDLKSQLAAADTMISGAESSLASADAQVLQAEAAVKQVEAEIQFAEEALKNTIIKSPITGKVTKLNAEVGESVVAGIMNQPGVVIMTIADLSRMTMEAEVAESDVVAVKPGKVARVYTIAHGERPFDGVVDQVALQRTDALDGTGYFETEISLRLEDEELKSGYIANTDIEIATHNGLIVPSQAVVDRDIDDLPLDVTRDNDVLDTNRRSTHVVYRMIDNKAVATPVKIGPSDLTHTLILDGLEEGDLVVTGPYKTLDTIKHDNSIRDINAKENEESPTPDDAPPPGE